MTERRRQIRSIARCARKGLTRNILANSGDQADQVVGTDEARRPRVHGPAPADGVTRSWRPAPGAAAGALRRVSPPVQGASATRSAPRFRAAGPRDPPARRAGRAGDTGG